MRQRLNAIAVAVVSAAAVLVGCAGAGNVAWGMADSLEKTYTYLQGEAAPAIPEQLTEDGTTWELERVFEPSSDPSFTPTTKVFTHADEGVFASIEEARAAFPATWHVQKGGFSGDIQQTSFVTEELVSQYTRIVDEVTTYGPFPTNDVAQLPEEAWTCGVSWEVTATSAIGVPVEYVATVTQKVAVPVSEVTGYRVSVTYEGEVARDEQRLMVTATYRPKTAAMPDAVGSGVPGDPENHTRSAGAALPLVAGSAAVAAAVGVVFFVRSRNVTVCTRGSERVIGRVHAVRDGAGLHVALPTRMSLARGAVLYVKPRLCDGSALRVSQAGVDVFDGFVEQRVELRPCASAATGSQGTSQDVRAG